jgi:hypothetical protein
LIAAAERRCARVTVVISPFDSLTLVFGEQTAQAGENAWLQQLSITTVIEKEPAREALLRDKMAAMETRAAQRWRVLSRALRVIGAVGFAVVFLWSALLISYYSAKRPHAPLPERGWTVGLEWTHPTSFGTAQEENRLLWCSWLALPFFGLVALGEIIKIYKLDDYSGVAHHFRNKPYFKHW